MVLETLRFARPHRECRGFALIASALMALSASGVEGLTAVAAPVARAGEGGDGLRTSRFSWQNSRS